VNRVVPLVAVLLAVGASVGVAGAGGETQTDDATTDASPSNTERVLVVADADTGETVLALPVSEGTRVTLAYTHSVEKTPVRDVYAVDGSRLEMVRMEFESYGAGLPSRADVTRENGSFVFDPGGSYRHLFVHPGDVAGHELVVGDRRYDLVDLSGGESVELFVARRCASDR
jgi:hypothetical protein